MTQGLKLWLVTRTDDIACHWDIFSEAVIAAESEETAKATHPSGDDAGWHEKRRTWVADPSGVSAQFIGIAADEVEAGVVLASFHAG